MKLEALDCFVEFDAALQREASQSQEARGYAYRPRHCVGSKDGEGVWYGEQGSRSEWVRLRIERGRDLNAQA